MIKNAAKRIYLVLICLILYAPIVTLMVLSFNNTKTRSRWGGFTGKWYVSLFQNKEIMNALYTTLIIALLSALIDPAGSHYIQYPLGDSECHAEIKADKQTHL